MSILLVSSGLFAQIPEKQMAKLQKGDVITSIEKDAASGDHVAVGKVVFDSSEDLVWKVLTNYNSYPEFLSDVKELKVRKRDGNRVWITFRFRNLFPFPDFKCEVVVDEAVSDGSIKLVMEKGDFEKYYASWKLTPLDQSRVLAEYRLYRYVGWWWFPFVPNTLNNESLVSDELSAFQKRIKLVKEQKSTQPGDVIKPIWRKSPFKEKDKSKEPASPAKESKPEDKADKQ